MHGRRISRVEEAHGPPSSHLVAHPGIAPEVVVQQAALRQPLVVLDEEQESSGGVVVSRRGEPSYEPPVLQPRAQRVDVAVQRFHHRIAVLPRHHARRALSASARGATTSYPRPQARLKNLRRYQPTTSASSPRVWLAGGQLCFFGDDAAAHRDARGTPRGTRPSKSRTARAHFNQSHATMLRPSRSEARKKGFKKVIDADEARRKREEGMIQIRKDKREEAFLKKRRCVPRVDSIGLRTRMAWLARRGRSPAVVGAFIRARRAAFYRPFQKTRRRGVIFPPSFSPPPCVVRPTPRPAAAASLTFNRLFAELTGMVPRPRAIRPRPPPQTTSPRCASVQIFPPPFPTAREKRRRLAPFPRADPRSSP